MLTVPRLESYFHWLVTNLTHRSSPSTNGLKSGTCLNGYNYDSVKICTCWYSKTWYLYISLCLFACFIDQKIGCLYGRQKYDWFIGWLVEQLIKLFHWLADWLIWLLIWLFDCLADRLKEYLIDSWWVDWLDDWLIEWLLDKSVIIWLISWLIELFVDWMTVWLIYRWMDGRIDWLAPTLNPQPHAGSHTPIHFNVVGRNTIC